MHSARYQNMNEILSGKIYHSLSILFQVNYPRLLVIFKIISDTFQKCTPSQKREFKNSLLALLKIPVGVDPPVCLFE